MPLSEVFKILVVDDNVENLNLACALLEPAGYRVLPALSGELALRAMEENLPDLILLDLRMPGMDGYAVCQHLKANERTRYIPVIFLTANHDLVDRIAAFQTGAVDYVTKPFCEEEVLARVRTHVHLYRHRRHLEELVEVRTRELSSSEAHLLRLSIFLQRVREEDRAHFARELHDELGQNLTALRIECNALAQGLAANSPDAGLKLDNIHQMINATVDATRRICEDMRPGMLDDLGLEPALAYCVRRFTDQYGVACDLSLDREDYGLDSTMSTAIYRIVQEALTNIARHAKAGHALVVMQDQGEQILLTIADDGCGLPENDPTSDRKSFGLLGMRERVQMLRGQISIDSAPGRGTHVEVCIPKFLGRELQS